MSCLGESTSLCPHLRLLAVLRMMRQAGAGVAFAGQTTGMLLAKGTLLPESSDGEMSPGVPVPLATGARGTQAAM